MLENVILKHVYGLPPFREELEKYLNSYALLKKNNEIRKSEYELIFCFIFLQVYLESCLCRDVRTIIERTNVISKEKWFEKNNDVVNEFSDISKKLELIRELFNLDKRKFNKNIKSPYEEITRIRNSFIHGHEIYDKTLISGKEQRKETSKTLDAIRDYKKLKNNIANILILERYWNEAIDIINKKNNGQKIDKRKFELEKSFDILDNLNVD